MTGPCSGAGVGVAKAGTTALTYVGPGAIGGALAGLSGWAGAAVGAAIGALTFELVTFCPNGPNAMPTFAAQDILDLLNPPLAVNYAASHQKMSDFIGNVFWPLLCDCTSGTSTLGTPSAYPSGAPTVINIYPGVTACIPSFTTSNQNIGSASSFNRGGASFTGQNATLLRIVATATVVTTDLGYNLQLRWYGPSTTGTLMSTENITLFGGTSTILRVPPAGAIAFQITDGANGTAAPYSNSHQTWDGFCDGQLPSGTQTPCCPPDASLQAQVDAILAAVTLIQRQIAPFGYVYGTNHTGLTGDGSLAVQGLLGVSVDVTTLPSSYGRASGTPEALFDLGFVTLGTADGYETSRRIDHDGTLFLPPAAGVYTSVGYTIAAGVTVAIRELIREP